MRAREQVLRAQEVGAVEGTASRLGERPGRAAPQRRGLRVGDAEFAPVAVGEFEVFADARGAGGTDRGEGGGAGVQVGAGALGHALVGDLLDEPAGEAVRGGVGRRRIRFDQPAATEPEQGGAERGRVQGGPARRSPAGRGR